MSSNGSLLMHICLCAALLKLAVHCTGERAGQRGGHFQTVPGPDGATGTAGAGALRLQ